MYKHENLFFFLRLLLFPELYCIFLQLLHLDLSSIWDALDKTNKEFINIWLTHRNSSTFLWSTQPFKLSRERSRVTSQIVIYVRVNLSVRLFTSQVPITVLLRKQNYNLLYNVICKVPKWYFSIFWWESETNLILSTKKNYKSENSVQPNSKILKDLHTNGIVR